MACLLLINHFGRPFEKFLVGLRIPAGIVAISVGVALLTGAWKEFRTFTGRMLLLMVFWFTVCIPFSSWRGGSFGYVRSYVILHVIFFLLVAAGNRTFKNIYWMSGITCVAVISHIFLGQETVAGRVHVEGTFGNANDVALLTGFVIPLVVLVCSRLPLGGFRYLLMLPSLGYLFYTNILAGSRTAVLALIAVFLLLLFRVSTKQRFLLMAGGVAITILTFVLAPDSLMSRFATILDSLDSSAVSAKGQESEAHASTAERIDLFWDGVYMMATNPVFGVGPSQYMLYRREIMVHASGEKKRWFPSHNTYIQIGSESGIPGLVLYLLFIGGIFFALRSSRKWNRPGSHPNWEQGNQITTTLEAVWLYFAIFAFFVTCDNHPHQFLLAGLAVAHARISAAYAKDYRTSKPQEAVPPQNALLTSRTYANVFVPKPQLNPSFRPARP